MNRLINSFFFESVTEAKIVEIAKPLRHNTAAGHTLTMRVEFLRGLSSVPYSS